jgi:hypothetical protein
MSIPNGVTLKHVSNIFRAIINKDRSKILLGRWALCENKNTNLVVDYSNEDHCGTCSQYVLEKQKVQTNKENIENIEKSEDIYRYEFEFLSTNTQQRNK